MCELAIQVMKNAFYALVVFSGGGGENEFMLMFGAGRRDYVGVFLNAPAQFLDAPSLLHVFFQTLDDSRKTNLQQKFANGVDGGRKYDRGDDVGWRKDASGCSVGERLESSLHCKGACIVDGPFEIGNGVGAELVFDISKGTVGCRGKVSREKIGEWEAVFPSLVANWFGDESPFFEFICFDRTIEAVFDGRFFEDDAPDEHHFNLFQHDFGFQNCKFELAGKDRTG